LGGAATAQVRASVGQNDRRSMQFIVDSTESDDARKDRNLPTGRRDGGCFIWGGAKLGPPSCQLAAALHSRTSETKAVAGGDSTTARVGGGRRGRNRPMLEGMR
jgi:hypothetical protein